MTRFSPTRADLAPHEQRHALRHLEWLCRASLPLLALTTWLWWRGGPEALLWPEVVSLAAGAAALALIWRAAWASRRGDLRRVAASLGWAGWALVAGQLVTLGWALWPGTGQPVSALSAVPVLLMLPVGLLPGLGLIVFSLVLRHVLDLRQDEELTV